jgi:prevent-host-death family protein
MKRVGIADLKARLSEHLRAVKRGRALTVVDRDRPVAVLSPVETAVLEVRKATRRAADVPQSRLPKRKTDSVAALLADRERR